MNYQVTKLFVRHMSTPCRIVKNKPQYIKQFEQKNKDSIERSSYYYMYHALIDYKNLRKQKNILPK